VANGHQQTAQHCVVHKPLHNTKASEKASEKATKIKRNKMCSASLLCTTTTHRRGPRPAALEGDGKNELADKVHKQRSPHTEHAMSRWERWMRGVVTSWTVHDAAWGASFSTRTRGCMRGQVEAGSVCNGQRRHNHSLRPQCEAARMMTPPRAKGCTGRAGRACRPLPSPHRQRAGAPQVVRVRGDPYAVAARDNQRDTRVEQHHNTQHWHRTTPHPP
jgi:hypothetical protein